ncbi:MAG: hypothetical protein ACRDKL_06410, partial [Solirubrobacteraceae bacterium]
CGDPPVPAGPRLGERERAEHLLLDRVVMLIQTGAVAQRRGGDGTEQLALARLACEVPDEIDDAPVFAAIRALLDAHDAVLAADPADRRALTLLLLAASVAGTPDVPLPAGVALPDQA